MALMMFSVYDSKVGAYAAPFIARTRGEAIRSFQQASADDNMPFKKFPADYSLFVIGEFDDVNGVLLPQKPDRLISADEF